MSLMDIADFNTGNCKVVILKVFGSSDNHNDDFF